MKLKDKPHVRKGFKCECLKFDNIAFMNMTLNHDNIEIYNIHEIFAIIIWVLHKKIEGKNIIFLSHGKRVM
jgi:hypothetical protein